MTRSIAIVGAACRYPDAASPEELWENVLARRQSFRRIPAERLPLDDYWSADASVPDRTYSQNAAVITNWSFDRAKYRVSRDTFESADLAHWLALEVADSAIVDAGFELPQGSTGVIVGNTLTGDSSRAASLRLRWPYVRRAALQAGITGEALQRLEETFNEPFAAIGEDSLAGGLANTIAGRICNYFGFNGGGYVVDGACSSSLLSVIHACNALAAGDLDVALAGGVDLSLDPFELVGFAKCTALARENMWVYDRKANGFLPGEGCGFVVLMRYEDAVAQGRRIHAKLLGWGMSSDGFGGMTRPEASGQRLALQRAYAKAGVPVDSVTLFEGHGTGTPVGDPIEVGTINSLITDAQPRPRYIGSIKANIGHTKAAAGIAGLLKSMMALREGVIPPITACTEPRDTGALQVSQEPQPWPADAPRRAAVSAMGFGGINTHVVLEAEESPRAEQAAPASSGWREREIFLFAAATREELRDQLDRVAARAAELSIAELRDLAAHLAQRITSRVWRAALVAGSPVELAAAAAAAKEHQTTKRPRIAFLFSGQGSIPNVTTDVAQPAIVRASLDRLSSLTALGIEAQAAIGHSLGELTALRWAGVMDDEQLEELATERGRLMQEQAGDGAMAALSCDERVAEKLLIDGAGIAAANGPSQTVVSGRAAAVEQVMAGAKAAGIQATRVPVNAAFHSSLMAPAREPLRDLVSGMSLRPLSARVFSTVTGDWLPRQTAVSELLATQLTAPVRFREAVEEIAAESDLLIEVGPGRVLTSLASFAGRPVVSTDHVEDAVAAAWTAGVEVNLDALVEGRRARAFDLETRPAFIVSPAERSASRAIPDGIEVTATPVRVKEAVAAQAPQGSTLRELVASHVELPLELVKPESKLLSDLHLSSITVARLLAETAKAMGVPPLADPMSFANATIAEATEALEALRGTEAPAEESRFAEGLESWLRAFELVEVAVPAAPRRRNAGEPRWRVLGEWPEAAGRLAAVAGQGIVVVLPDSKDVGERMAQSMALLLEARAVADGERLVVVQRHPGGAGFARTLHLERPKVAVRIVNVPHLDAAAAEQVAREMESTGDFCEATYRDGVRYEPRLRVATVRDTAKPALTADDTLLVTGGGKGIGFETALHFARETGAKLVLLGRSAEDDELRGNFARLDAAGVRYRYVTGDVTKPLPKFPEVTAVLHAAGTNSPALLDALDEESFRRATSPKVDGLLNVLDAVGPLKLLVTFGSVIARTGMRGEAHYAFANEWLAAMTGEYGRLHEESRAICIEYSVWAGMGMGERLGTVDALRRQGITPVSPDSATRLALRLAGAPPAAHIVASGRIGDPPTLRFVDEAPPLLRFIEHTRVHVPGVELVVDSDLSSRNDPYLDDHVFGGEPLFPAVAGMEAMVQAAQCLAGGTAVRIEELDLMHPVTASTVRIASVLEGDHVRLALRSSGTQFKLDHFRARVAMGDPRERPFISIPEGVVELTPEHDLYGPLLFHTGRFRRVRGYRRLSATECVVELTPSDAPAFHRYLPSNLLLGDLTVRDAAIHALQASIPHATVLPQKIASVELFAPVTGEAIVIAHETERYADSFVWDVDIASPDGQVFERWHGLRLQVVARRSSVDDLAPALWAPFLERELGVRVEVAKDALDRVAGPVLHRKDGKPVAEGVHVSASHDRAIGLAVASDRPVGCDVQFVSGQPWSEIIGAHDTPLAEVCSRIAGDEHPFAAARVWSARESMKKLSGDPLVPMTVHAAGEHRRVTFRSGNHRIDTFVMRDCVVAVAQN